MIDPFFAKVASSGYAFANVYQIQGEWGVTLSLASNRHIIAWGRGETFLDAGEEAFKNIEAKSLEHKLMLAETQKFLNSFHVKEGFVRRI